MNIRTMGMSAKKPLFHLFVMLSEEISGLVVGKQQACPF